MYLTVTVDTEEDDWGKYDLESYGVENISRIPLVQKVFERHHVRATYLITYPVATSPEAVRILGDLSERHACEIGAHPHPWNTPPARPQRMPEDGFMCNLPAELQFQKIRNLTEAIETSFGHRPTSYRSGRWAFDETVAQQLVRLGYRVDTSVFPAWDWSALGGNDYSTWSHEPYVYRAQSEDGSAAGSLLEVPATVGFLQSRTSLARSAFRALKRLPAGDQVTAVLRRLRLLNHVCVSPEINDAADMIRLAERLLARGTKVINMFFHSPTLLEGRSPFARTSAEVAAFVDRIDRFLTFAQAAGLRSVTMSELTPAAVGATGSKVLPAFDAVVEVKS